jgi:hypothetical protein
MLHAVSARCSRPLFIQPIRSQPTHHLHQQLLDVDQNNTAFPGGFCMSLARRARSVCDPGNDQQFNLGDTGDVP